MSKEKRLGNDVSVCAQTTLQGMNPAPRFVAHVSNDGKRFESVASHLEKTAELASRFAEPFGAADWARAAAMAHDIGKYSDAFQSRILRNGPKVDHSTAGAYELRGEAGGMLSYCVAGHHGGLPNGGSQVDDGGTLLGRLNAASRGKIPDYEAFRKSISIPSPKPPSFSVLPKTMEDKAFSISFLTRMVYSCLVDADFLSTESFMNGKGRIGLASEELDVLRDRLEQRIRKFYPPQGNVNEARCGMLDDCLAASQGGTGVYALTAQTGSGKTLGVARFGLNHACSNAAGQRRIIFAIPYTSIIEQNAQVYREVFGDENVLEHHSSVDFDDSDDPTSVHYRMRLAAENWDAPLVVTTNVQLFETLYASKPSRCRKLHNIANSVIVLDEAQMLPLRYLKPCIKALSELVKNYGCTVVLCSATQPCLDDYFANEGLQVKEIVSNPQKLSEALSRVRYKSEGRLSDDEISERLATHKQALCIVNSRKQARVLYEKLAELLGSDAVYHLTTMMHSVHRRRILANVEDRLNKGAPCILVATSLVEAGVDIDFPSVYRALAGVDSLVQAAGRCNRAGRRDPAKSIVHLFIPADSYAIPSETVQRSVVAQSVLPQLSSSSDTE